MFTHFMFKGAAAPAASTLWTYGSEVDATNGGSDDLTHVTVLSGLSAGLTDLDPFGYNIGTDADNQDICIQLGDSGGFENTGYDNACKVAATSEVRTDGFFSSPSGVTDASDEQRTIWRLMRYATDENLWFCWTSCMENTGTASRVSFGYKTLSGELTQIRFTTVDEVAAFDEGTVIGRYR
jgi:hypothetical protein